MADNVEYKVKLVKEADKQDIPLNICRISPKGLLLIIGISLILILAVPYSGIFSSTSHHKDISSSSSNGQTFDNVLGLAKFKDSKLKTGLMNPKCELIKAQDILDCYPEGSGDETKCLQRGCCWNAPSSPQQQNRDTGAGGLPSCFYPPDYLSYKMIGDPREKDFGYEVTLRRNDASPYPTDIVMLQMNVYLETDNRLHFKIFDPSDQRYEVPIATPPTPSSKATNLAYEVNMSHSPFGIAVIRKQDILTLLNSSIGPLIFSDQFIQILSSLVSNYLYGLGEHRNTLALPTDWKTCTIWTQEPDGVRENQKLYGVHPFYLNMEPNTGHAHGVFLLNSNAMDVALQPTPAITYRTIGGILDFYIFMGPTPADVIAQYTEVIGRPFMPPYWGLGFHLCRWGYLSANNTWDMVRRMKAAGIPQDVQWNDIEYATDNKIFTYNNSSFSNLPEFVQDLHDYDQRYIQIVDPGIHNETGYSPWDNGIVKNVFITDRDGEPLIGKVWPGTTAFPDFLDDATIAWWTDSAGAYHKDIPFDGMWIDMNEPSNVFANGSVVDGCPNEEPYDNLPYLPGVYGNSLIQNSFCLSANHHNHGKHFDLHSLYGWSMIKASNIALKAIRSNQRAFIITRSSYPSSGVYGGKWFIITRSSYPSSGVYGGKWFVITRSSYPSSGVYGGKWFVITRSSYPSSGVYGGKWFVITRSSYPSSGVYGGKWFVITRSSYPSSGVYGGKWFVITRSSYPSSGVYGSKWFVITRSSYPSSGVYGGKWFVITRSSYPSSGVYGGKWFVITRSSYPSSGVYGSKWFVITRSSYPSSGVYGGKWLGDNYSKWPDMYFSIPGILAFNMFGIPLVGADICGFNDNTTEALCQRWTQLGAFYPFSRNHNSWSCPLDGKDISPCVSQDPTAFSDAMQKSTRKVLLTRYSLLPYLYTLFYRAHINGTTVARPLFFEFPDDEKTYSIDKQFLWGSGLLISPVLIEDATSVEAVFPKGVWYDFYLGTRMTYTSTTQVTLDAPLDHLNLHVSGGNILPMQKPNITTTTSRLNQFELLVALSDDGSACGDLFWDDGDSVDSIDEGKFTYMTFEAVDNNAIKSVVIKKGYTGPKMLLGLVTVYGVLSAPKDVTINGNAAKFSYNKSQSHGVLKINCSSKPIPLEVPFLIKWTLPGGTNGVKDQLATDDVGDKVKLSEKGEAVKDNDTAQNKVPSETGKDVTGGKQGVSSKDQEHLIPQKDKHQKNSKHKDFVGKDNMDRTKVWKKKKRTHLKNGPVKEMVKDGKKKSHPALR